MVKTWTRKEIDNMLHTNPKAVERAMVVLFNRQTQDEQKAEDTKHQNGVGFSSWAARSGTYYANWIKDGRSLTRHHLEKARKIALKHSSQLVEEANERSSLTETVTPVSGQESPKFKLTKAEAGVKGELTNEQLAAEMNAENYGATGVDRYDAILDRLSKEDTKESQDIRERDHCVMPHEIERESKPSEPSWAATARMMAKLFPNTNVDWDLWKDEMK